MAFRCVTNREPDRPRRAIVNFSLSSPNKLNCMHVSSMFPFKACYPDVVLCQSVFEASLLVVLGFVFLP